MSANADWDVVVIGGINTDYLIRGEKFPRPGQTVEGEVFQQGPGGKGANQAVAAARLGARVAMVGRVGRGLRGEAMVVALAEEGIDTRYIMRDDHAETGAAVVMVERSGENQIVTAPGANLAVTIYDVLKAEPVIRTSRVLLTQLEVPVAAIAEALRIAKANAVQTILDPAPPGRIDRSVLYNVDIIKPNSDEAEALTGIYVDDRISALAAANKLLAEGVQTVVIQAGDEGTLMVWRGGQHWLPKVPVESIDTTGSGDAFAGALAFQLARGKSVVEAATFANSAAALATMKLGAQVSLPRREEVEALLGKLAA